MRIGTRGSALALAQAGYVAELFDEAELVTITTSGDSDARPHARGQDKSRWVDTIEAALLAGEIDLAVHSAKDVPGELAGGLLLLGAPARVSAEDVLCGAPGLDALSNGARVGTSSLRRGAQLRAVREDLQVVAIGGNVDTRLLRLDEDDLDAIVLARAGLQRLGREAEAGMVLDPARFVPAPGQGVLALEGRAEDSAVAEAVHAITDPDTFACLHAERAVASAFERELPHATWRPRGTRRLRLLEPTRLGRTPRRLGLGERRVARRLLRSRSARTPRGRAHDGGRSRGAAAPSGGNGR